MVGRENHVARFLNFAQKLSQRGDTAPDGVIAETLGAEANTPEFYRRIPELIDLAKRARVQIDELAGQPGCNLFMDAINSIISVLERLSMRENWTNYLPVFNARALGQLEICVHIIETWMPLKKPTQEMLDELLQGIRESIDEVTEADLEVEVKQLLLEMLRGVERALLAYEVSGLYGLRIAVERSIGSTMLHYDSLMKSKRGDVVKQSLGRIWNVVDFLGNVEFLIEIPEKVRNILELLP
jgi:hypothetical protein